MNNSPDRFFFQLSIVILLTIYAVVFNQLGLNSNGFFAARNLKFAASPPQEVSHYDLRFTRLNEQPLAEPLYFDEAVGWVPEDKIYDGRQLINQLGIALYRNDLPLSEDLLNLVQRELFGSIYSAEYELVFIVVNPVEKYQLGSNVSEEIIAVYEFERPPQVATLH